MSMHSAPSHPLTLSNPPGLYDPSANGYSHVAQVAADTRLVFIAGQGGETADGQLSADFPIKYARLWPTCRRPCVRSAPRSARWPS
jgi:enamine deaminase RidA (YjgF/YER057c/UK114 family)